jgi:hypothetical protein
MISVRKLGSASMMMEKHQAPRFVVSTSVQVFPFADRGFLEIDEDGFVRYARL